MVDHWLQAISACQEWDSLYRTAVLATQKYTSKPWSFDRTPIFAHTDAFVQRCRRESLCSMQPALSVLVSVCD